MVLRHIVQKCSTPHSRMPASHDICPVWTRLTKQVLLHPRLWLFRMWMIFSLSPVASRFSADCKWRKLSRVAPLYRLFHLPWSGGPHPFNVHTSHPPLSKICHFIPLTFALHVFSSVEDRQHLPFYLYTSLFAHLDWLNGRAANHRYLVNPPV